MIYSVYIGVPPMIQALLPCAISWSSKHLLPVDLRRTTSPLLTKRVLRVFDVVLINDNQYQLVINST